MMQFISSGLFLAELNLVITILVLRRASFDVLKGNLFTIILMPSMGKYRVQGEIIAIKGAKDKFAILVAR
jgi:hypothetical protein